MNHLNGRPLKPRNWFEKLMYQLFGRFTQRSSNTKVSVVGNNNVVNSYTSQTGHKDDLHGG